MESTSLWSTKEQVAFRVLVYLDNSLINGGLFAVLDNNIMDQIVQSTPSYLNQPLIHIPKVHVVMHVFLCHPSVRQLPLHATSRWSSQAIGSRIPSPIHNAEGRGYDYCTGVDRYNGYLGRYVPDLVRYGASMELLTSSGDAYAGASFAWKVWGPITLAMLNAAETRELPDTCSSQLFAQRGRVNRKIYIPS